MLSINEKIIINCYQSMEKINIICNILYETIYLNLFLEFYLSKFNYKQKAKKVNVSLQF